MITIYSGKPGSGKSLKLADEIVGLLARNLKWNAKSGKNRKVWSNIKLSKELTDAYPGQVHYWQDPEELILAKDCDIIWDEIATHLDSTQWANVPMDLKRFLQQHRKRGIEIYGTTQAFGMVDISMRRLVDELHICYKVLGSRNPSPTKPPVKYVWGLIWINQVDPSTFDSEKQTKVGADWLFITRPLVSVYDTLQEIPMGQMPALRHSVRKCNTCGHEKIVHA